MRRGLDLFPGLRRARRLRFGTVAEFVVPGGAPACELFLFGERPEEAGCRVPAGLTPALSW